MEAMAVGVPCISTDCPCGGPRELIKNNINGLLVKSNDKNELVSAMCKIIENDKMCKKIAMSAKKNMNNYSCDKIVSKWFEFMKEVYKNEKNN